MDNTERGMRGAFALFDLIPAGKYLSGLAKTGKTAGLTAVKTSLKTSIKEGVEQGVKNLDNLKGILKSTKGLTDNMISQLKTYGKQLDNLRPSKILSNSADDLSDAAQRFSLNSLEQLQPVTGSIPFEGGKLTHQADNLSAFAKNLDGSADDVVESLSRSTLADNINVVQTVQADEVNTWWKTEMGYDNPPYKPGTSVDIISLKRETTFVRVYDGEVSGQFGGWLMNLDDIKGLTPEEIRDVYALPAIPKYMTDVTLESGTTLRTGIVNPLEGWGKGGARQFDLMGQRTGKFTNERLIQW